MRIAVFELEDWERRVFDQLLPEHSLQLYSETLNAKTAAKHADAEAVSTFIYSRIDDAVLDALPNLRLIATRSTGYDHIPMARCRERGISVCNVPTYGTHTVAEHVFALLLTISHKMEAAVDRTRKGDFSLKGLQGFDLHGKTFGVVGTGDIGRATIAIARGFGMRVIATDIAPDEAAAAEMNFEYVPFDTLLEQSDIVSLHVPANEMTRNLMGRPQFERMKRGAVLINTARGAVVETKALLRALAEGRISAAGLDVLPEEPTIREEAELLRSVFETSHNLESLLADHVLVHMRNVIVTPHSAFNTREAVERILETTLENIRAFAAGAPINVVS
ncbi:MAG: hydroxyacid dehydrogenase [Candidatus Hydrogenedentales bacterium]